MAFRIRLTGEEKTALFVELEDGLIDAMRDRSKFDKRRIAIENAYRNRVRKKTEPWDGCSNTSLPIITRNVERMTIHTMQTVAPRGNFSTITAVSVSSNVIPGQMDHAEDVSEYLGYNYRNKMDLVRGWEVFTRSFIKHGNGYGILFWSRREMKVRRVDRQPAWNRVEKDPEVFQREQAEDPEAVPFEEVQVQVEESMDRLHGNNANLTMRVLKVVDGNFRKEYRFFDVREREMRTVVAEGYYEENTRDNVILTQRTILAENQPKFRPIELDDIYFTTETSSVKTSSRVWVRHRNVTIANIEQKFRRGIYNAIDEAGLELLKKRVSVNKKTGAVDTELRAHTPLDRSSPSVRSQQDKNEGVVTHRAQPFEVWECFATIDLDKDGEDEELVVWIERETKTVLRVAHLHEEYGSSKRPLIEAVFIPIGDRPLGIGVGELQMPLLVELNALFNNRSDSASILLQPGGFYRPGSGFYPNRIPWRPGTWLQVDNPQQDVSPFVPTANMRETVALEQFLLAMSEDLGVSTFSTGSGPQRPNAPRTARGTLAIMQQDNIKMDYILIRLMPALVDLCQQTVYQLRINGPDHETFRVVGSKSVKTISREDLEQDYDFYFEVDAVSANKEIQRIFATAAFQGAIGIASQPPEAVTPGARALARRFLAAYEVKDNKTIIPDPPGFMRNPQDQEFENQLLFQGIEVEPVMADDHVGSIAKMDEEELGEVFNSMSPEWVTAIWAPHKQKHVRLLETKERMIQQQVGQGGQGGNGNGLAGIPGPQGGIAGELLAAEAPGGPLSG